MSPQQTIAHYRITAKLGEGGMGEVWRATDTKLGREVAIKVLPAEFATDPDRLARFQREAQVLASLNHPNIAAIYGVETAGGVSVLVMELVEGPTIEERIAQGPIPSADALPIAVQIAEALEAAHERGVVHRDLKPANVKIAPEGRVKVLDFGLAKAPEPAGPADAKNSPTLTMRATQAGMIMGTAGYMSPEQAAGLPVDKRADIWSFGVVLWEMLTGRRLFEGETVSHTLADVLRAEIDLHALPADTPAVARTIVRRCLDRKLKNRLRDIGEARIALGDYLANPAAAAAEAMPAARPGKLPAWIAAGLLAAALAMLGAVHFREQPAQLPVVRFAIGPPEKAAFGHVLGVVAGFAVSPDGRRMLFSASQAGGRDQLWVRSLDSFAAQPLAGTDGATFPFWSPDSRSIGFAADGKLKRIDAAGGPALALADAPNFRGGAWSPGGTILFMAGFNQPLQRVPAAGGIASAATAQAKGEFAQRFPCFLPDGRHFLYASQSNTVDHVTIRTGSLDSTETQVLLEANSHAVYAEGHLLYLRDSTLMAQPFDAGRRVTTGDAVPVAEKVGRVYAANAALGSFTVSANGVLAYAGGEWAGVSMIWVDRTGQRLAPPFDPGFLISFNLSPDRRSAAAGVLTGGNADIWVYDLSRSGLRSRFTFSQASERDAIWSPDGRTIVFDSNAKGRYDLYRKNADGAGAEELLFADQENKTPTSWSPDGKVLLYETGTMPSAIWVLPLAPETPGGPLKPHPWLQTGFFAQGGRFSPDGKWIVYQSNESGRAEIYVAPFPGPGGKRQVSTAGGVGARWRSDGREIFYIAPDDKLMAVDVTIREAAIEFGQPHSLFGLSAQGATANYDVSADGRRILAMTPSVETGRAGETISLVQNWMAGLKR